MQRDGWTEEQRDVLSSRKFVWKWTMIEDMSLLLVVGCLFWFFPVLLFPRLLSLCCSEFEDSIDIELNTDNSVQLRLCFSFFFQPLAFLIEIQCIAHCHLIV